MWKYPLLHSFFSPSLSFPPYHFKIFRYLSTFSSSPDIILLSSLSPLLYFFYSSPLIRAKQAVASGAANEVAGSGAIPVPTQCHRQWQQWGGSKKRCHCRRRGGDWEWVDPSPSPPRHCLLRWGGPWWWPDPRHRRRHRELVFRLFFFYNVADVSTNCRIEQDQILCGARENKKSTSFSENKRYLKSMELSRSDRLDAVGQTATLSLVRQQPCLWSYRLLISSPARCRCCRRHCRCRSNRS